MHHVFFLNIILGKSQVQFSSAVLLFIWYLQLLGFHMDAKQFDHDPDMKYSSFKILTLFSLCQFNFLAFKARFYSINHLFEVYSLYCITFWQGNKTSLLVYLYKAATRGHIYILFYCLKLHLHRFTQYFTPTRIFNSFMLTHESFILHSYS